MGSAITDTDRGPAVHPLLDVGGEPPSSRSRTPRQVDWRQPMALVAIVFSVVAFAVAWYGIANTENEWEQLPYLASGGALGVLGLGAAIALMVSVEHTRDREAVGELVAEIRHLRARVESLEASASRRGR